MKNSRSSQLKIIGENCRRWRQFSLTDIESVANDLGYSVETIYKFEQGKNNNALILMYYISNFIDLSDGGYLCR